MSKRNVLVIAYLFILSLYLSLQSHFMPFSDFNLGHDAGIFAYIGLGMKRGLVLYTQLWENKGPLLYIINFFGILISQRYGIFIIELLTIFTAVIFAYKTARFLSGKIISIVSVTYTFLVIIPVLERGNLSEEYALPFICAGIYLLSRFYFQNYTLKLHQCFCSGAMFAGAFLLRANLVAAFAAFGFVIIIIMLVKLKIFELIKYGLLVFAGMITAALPVVFYLVKNNALQACLDSAYLGVMGGFVAQDPGDRLMANLHMMFDLNNSYVFIIFIYFLVAAVYAILKRQRVDAVKLFLLTSTVLSLILNTYVNSITGVYHPHYYISFIPLLVIPSVIFWDSVHKLVAVLIFSGAKKTAGFKYISIAVIIALSLVMSFGNIAMHNKIVMKSLRGAADIKNTTAQKLSDFIDDNTRPEDRVYFLTNSGATTVLYRADRLSASRYSYLPITFPSFTEARKREMVSEAVGELLKNPPEMLVVDPVWYKIFLGYLDNRQQWEDFMGNYKETGKIGEYRLLKLIHGGE